MGFLRHDAFRPQLSQSIWDIAQRISQARRSSSVWGAPGSGNLNWIVRIKDTDTREQFAEIHKAVMATSPNFHDVEHAPLQFPHT